MRHTNICILIKAHQYLYSYKGKSHTNVEGDVDTTPIKPDRRKSVDQMISMFGSEKKKRAFSAAQKNKLEGDVLETALATAVTHAQNEIDKMAPGKLKTCISVGILANV